MFVSRKKYNELIDREVNTYFSYILARYELKKSKQELNALKATIINHEGISKKSKKVLNEVVGLE